MARKSKGTEGTMGDGVLDQVRSWIQKPIEAATNTRKRVPGRRHTAQYVEEWDEELTKRGK